MTHRSANQAFWAIVALASICALFTPRSQSFTGTTRSVQSIGAMFFAPVSLPIHLIGTALMSHKTSAEPEEVTRNRQELQAQNESLKVEVANLTEQLNSLKQLNADRALLGPLRPLSQPMVVVGGDAGVRDTLLLKPTMSIDHPENLPVIYPGGVVGRLDRYGSQVRLITDKGFGVTGAFGRFRAQGQKQEFVRLASPPPLVQGIGNGRMSILNLTKREVTEATLAKGDWVVLNDNDWPMALQGLKVGRIIEIGDRADAPQYADIRVEPLTKLQSLREVMVLTKGM